MTIQSESEENKILEQIVAASEEFLQSAGSKINYQKITDTVAYISGAKYVVFSLYDTGGNKFITTAISAPEGMIKKVSSLLGFKLPGKNGTTTRFAPGKQSPPQSPIFHLCLNLQETPFPNRLFIFWRRLLLQEK
jgi:hypothetical protein